MELRPSEIRYSQRDISCTFRKKSKHGHLKIGQTLDDLYGGNCQISDIPIIKVAKIKERWTTDDNRRLWIFRHLERLGKCTQIRVKVIKRIYFAKLNSRNDGEDIHLRNDHDPGGVCHKLPAPAKESQYDGLSDGVTYMDPMKMKYTKTHISATFDDGKPLISLKESLRRGMTSVRSVPPLEVHKAYGFYYVIDGNRRLNVFRDVKQNYDLALLVKVKVTYMEDDEDDFVDTIRERYPNLQLFDILKMGDSVTVT